MSHAPHESLYSTELVQVLVEHFWTRYYAIIFFTCLIPFFIYFVLVLIYSSEFVIFRPENIKEIESTQEIVIRIAIICLLLYFASLDVLCMFRDGWTYLKDIFNWVDMFSILINVFVLIETSNKFDKDHVKIVRPIAALGVILMWIKAFYWLRIFTGTSFYVRLIRDTLYDIRHFLILFILILFTFGNALLILNQGRDDDLFFNFFKFTIFNAVMNQYMLSLGEFNTENFSNEGGDYIVWLVFIASTFVTQITFLNMLIAIMGDTFDKATEVKEQSALKEKIDILADYVAIVGRESS